MFENIIGHESNIGILKQSLNENNIFHSYLFYGESGIGKFKVAQEFAKEILGVKNLEASPDYKLISKLENKKDILIDQVRKEILEDIYIVPANSDKKVYIINEAHLLNESAQNAILKTLEEPPKYVVIILIADILDNFLPTILSRLYKLRFLPLSDEIIYKYIDENYGIKFNSNTLNYINGSLGLAIRIVNEEKQNEFNQIDELYSYINEKSDVKSMLKSSDINFKDNINLEYLEFLMFKNNKCEGVNIIEKAKKHLKYNGNYDIVMDNMILKLAENM